MCNTTNAEYVKSCMELYQQVKQEYNIIYTNEIGRFVVLFDIQYCK